MKLNTNIVLNIVLNSYSYVSKLSKFHHQANALKGVRSSAVADHSLRTGHGVDWSNVKILACDYNEHNLFYLERLLILKLKPTLNKMQTSVIIDLFT